MSAGKFSLPTRTSLIRRVQNESEQTKWQKGWEEFYGIYRPLIVGVACMAGLKQAEAEDLMQDVMAEVQKRIQGFQVDRKRGPFKAWLLRLVRWRICDHLRKRTPIGVSDAEAAASVVDPNSPGFTELWEEEWHDRLMDEAVKRVKKKVNPNHFQIFRFCTSREIDATAVAKKFRVSTGQVYLAKFRVSNLIKKEIKKLEKAMEEGRGGSGGFALSPEERPGA